MSRDRRRERFTWIPDMLEVTEGTVEVTPADEREVDRRLEADHFDPGEDDYGDWYSGADR
jgi:hypothetical protein